MGEKLTDIEINHCQKMLKLQFPKLNGLRSTLQQDKPSNDLSPQLIGFKLFIVRHVIIGLQQQPLAVTSEWWRYVTPFSETLMNLQNRFYTNVFPVTLTSKL